MDPTLWIPITAAAAANTTIWGDLAGRIARRLIPADVSDSSVDSKFTPKQPIRLQAEILHEGEKHYLVFKGITFTTIEIDPDTGDQRIKKSKPYNIRCELEDYEEGKKITIQNLLNYLAAEDAKIRIFDENGTEISSQYNKNEYDSGKKALNESLATFLFGNPQSTLTIKGETTSKTSRTIYNAELTENLFEEAVENPDLLSVYYKKQQDYFRASAQKLRESSQELENKEREARTGLLKYFGGTVGMTAVATGVTVGAIALLTAVFPPVGAALAAAGAAIAGAAAIFTPSAILSAAVYLFYIAVWMGVLAVGSNGIKNNFKRFNNRYFKPLREKMSKKTIEIADKTDQAVGKLEIEKKQILKVIELANRKPQPTTLDLSEVKNLEGADGKIISPSKIVTTIVKLIKAGKLNDCKTIDLSGCYIDEKDRKILEDALKNSPDECELESIKLGENDILHAYEDAVGDSQKQIAKKLGEHASSRAPASDSPEVKHEETRPKESSQPHSQQNSGHEFK